MAIEYALLENNLTPNPNDYAAHVQITGSADLNTIVHRITDQGSTWSAQDITAVLGEVVHTCESLLLEGFRINIGGLCELYPRVTGVFEGATDHFDHTRHRIDVGASPAAYIRKLIRDNGHTAKVEAVKPIPAPIEYTDTGSGDVNGALTPGNIGTIDGHRLKFDLALADEGIFLISANGEETRISVVQKNKPSQLVFLVPNVKPGDYHVEVRAHIQGGAELRAGRLGATLTVSRKNKGED
uniref:Uncharacterized protein n=1 Tax=Candidatus Kentrum sp. MB TaxID=2138164 RepID=A0A451B8G5_9GAMM|nr:MAG: protein of unknown function (DUF4469) with IG-like fold [Candidatus Kentron sp. MB]VFK26661.1 MAG: protein of unknown function (DUF4469) with IG-like fold [Candidatus Kentron sp. MB]VFK74588.1 MAG: protein of unknown function (DUF4469) with IG-like fold [Candidatus Kentron sp. MB]